jgi:hypothetical protein
MSETLSRTLKSAFLSFSGIVKGHGEVLEWFNRQSWKDCERATVPGVRIPPSPHTKKRSILH